MRFLNAAAVKKAIQENGRRAGREFLVALDEHVEHKILAACRTRNGTKITLDRSVAQHLGLFAKEREHEVAERGKKEKHNG